MPGWCTGAGSRIPPVRCVELRGKPVMSEFRTERLAFREYTESDRADFVRLHGNPTVMQHMGGPETPRTASEHFDCPASGGGAHDNTAWAIVEKESGVYLGHAFVLSRADRAYPEIGFLLFPVHWGCGIGTEVAGGLVAHLFGETDLPGLSATADAAHAAYIRVLENVGFHFATVEHGAQGARRVYCLTSEMYAQY